MEKDFDGWNAQKKSAHKKQHRAPFKEGDVWWCSLGVNVGDEQDGKGRFFSRPVLVLKKFNARIFVGLPLSTQLKEKPYYHRFHFKGIDQSIILSQIRLIDAKRLENRMGEIPSNEIVMIRQKVRELLC